MRSHAGVTEILGPSVAQGIGDVWPERNDMRPGNPIKLSALAVRYADAGAELRSFRDSTEPGAWTHLSRANVAEESRKRLIDPGLMSQEDTGLCGPMAILFELARRQPAEYVRMAASLFDTGRFETVTGRVIGAETELRRERLPGDIHQVDWLLAGTMRDDENWIEDVDSDGGGPLGTDFNGIETLTWPLEMKHWVRGVLGLSADVDDCWAAGEEEALSNGDNAVRAGGIAILCIDSNLIRDGSADDEEDVFWVRTEHHPDLESLRPRTSSALTHSVDDTYWPDHYAALIQPVDWTPGNFEVRLYSWGSEFVVTGSPSSFWEYLYNVIIGRP